ncbi:hypothetical protein [Candidatus Symbiobacter mobilis]|uniref:Uncharacterized protein n=1 Tax=Candidatus Symbiobacter mobilis CR TaxID=946483 RepID=U5N8H2_9BURK|nr:hypothetical protein [Candidatus Symbiobacter mobilis]AGX87707.1 hypothetical protein Cenrod_1622 [Candidatus Symbiobacter mobilis CR]
MKFTLQSAHLTLELCPPGAAYQGARFDWSGQITQLHYRKHSFCTTESLDLTWLHHAGRGLYNEFGIDTALGYVDCPVGEKFHKIGVGLLTRATAEPYRFAHLYPVDPAKFDVQRSEDRAVFTVTAPTVRGYAYTLVKTISVLDTAVRIHYRLHNTGTKRIDTNEYVHHFLAVDHHPLNRDYTLRFSFDPEPATFGETVNVEGCVVFENNAMRWVGTPSEPFFFGAIHPPADTTQAFWELGHESTGVAIRETVSFPPEKLNIWGTSHVVSPEIFYPIRLGPGEECEWERVVEVLG